MPLKIEEGYFNLSGIENKIKQLLSNGLAPEEMIYILFSELGRMLHKLLKAAILKEQPDLLILAGGVMSNHWIREQLEKLSEDFPDITFILTPTTLCTDNAVGTAKMALKSALNQG